jgi:sugar lactone lactonase YvrE
MATWRAGKHLRASALLASAIVLAVAAIAGGSEPRDTYETTIAGDSPVAQYRFEDAAEATTLNDTAGSNDATNHGILLGQEGPFGGSASGQFDGEAYASLTANPLEGASEFTAEAWVRWSGGSSYEEPIFDFGSSSTNHLELTPAATATGHPLQFELHTSEGASAQVTAPQLGEGAWHYVAVTESSAGDLKLYVDGAEVGNAEGATVEPADLGSASTAYVGRSLASAPGFAGRLSNLAFYATALSPSAIKAHFYAGEFPVDTTAPSISGVSEDGAELTAHHEDWTGLTPIEFGYQWRRCNSSGESCSDIAGATEASYSAGAEDVGSKLRVLVTATNSAGSSEAVSGSTATIAPAAPAELGYDSEFGTQGSGDGQFNEPWSIAIGAGGDLFVLDHGNGRIEVFSPAGEYLRQFGTPGSGEEQLGSPEGVAIDANGNVWIPDYGDGHLKEFTEAGEFVRSVPEVYGLGIAVDRNDDLWVSTIFQGLMVFNDEGEFLKAVGGYGSEPGQFDRPMGLTVDANGHVWVADWGNNRVQEFTEAGGFMATFGTWGWGAGEMSSPATVATHDGYVFVGEAGNLRVQEFDEEGHFVSRQGITGFDPGDLREPLGLAVDSAGNLWIVDVINNKVQKWSPEAPGAPTSLQEPSISGIAGVGSTLTSDTGVWSGSPRRSYDYQWQRCDSEGESCNDIPGATGFTHALMSSDLGSRLRVTVTATNSYGSAPSTSGATEVVGNPPANTAPPTISGTPEEGQLLTANRGAWEGAERIELNWLRCDEHGEECTVIAEAEGEEYTATANDIGYTLRFRETSYNPSGETTVTSSPSEVVVAAPVNTAPPSISGRATQNQTLTVEPGEWTGTPPLSYTYQWQSCDSLGEGCLDIPGATGTSYELQPSDVGTTIRVVETATNEYGTASRAAAATEAVLPAPVNTELPEVSGAAQEGQPLNASPGSWEGLVEFYVYQWQRCDEHGEECEDIISPEVTTYRPIAEDVGHTIRIVVTAVDASRPTSIETTAASPPTEVVAPAPPENVNPPWISGTQEEGMALTAELGEWSGTPPLTYTYQWQSCDGLGEGCLDIPGATEASYELQASDVGATVRVNVTATNGEGFASRYTEATTVIVPRTAYQFAMEFGSEGTGNGQFDHPADVALDGEGNIFVLDNGNDRVEVFNAAGEYLRQFGSPGSGEGDLSDPYGLAVDSAGNVWVLDRGNQRLEEFDDEGAFVRTVDIEDLEYPEGIAVDHKDDVWVSATYKGHLVVFGSKGERLKTIGSTGSGPGQLNEPEELSVDGNGHVWVAEWGNNRVQEFDEEGEYLANFGSAGSEPGEIQSPYAIAAVGGYVFVGETGNNRVQEFEEDGTYIERIGGAGAGPGEYLLSYPIGTAVDAAEDLLIPDAGHNRIAIWRPPVPGPPTNTIPPWIAGEPLEFATLTANAGFWGGSRPIGFSYQWERCDEHGEGCAEIEGATAVTYEPGAEDVGATLRVSVTASNTLGSKARATSPTAVIEGATPPSNTSVPAIAGEARVGQALSASAGSWGGTAPLVYSYQWLSCDLEGGSCQPIEGATDPIYDLSEGDLETTVRVKVTATNLAGEASVSAAATDEVLPGPPVEVEAPSIAGAAQEGRTLRVDAGQWGGVEPTISYQWERCDEAGRECAEIPGADADEYTATAGDLEKTLRARVGAANEEGAITEVTPATAVVEVASSIQATAAVAISGSAQAGETLSASRGSWLGSPGLSYAYRWERCDAAGNGCATIEGASESTYELTEADVGQTIRVAVAASEWEASAAQVSETTVPVAALGAPVVQETPSAIGTTLVGATLRADPGQFQSEAPAELSYRWERCDAFGEECEAIGGATSATYTLTEADAEATVRVLVIATFSGLETSAPSAALSVSPAALTARTAPKAAGAYHDGQTLTAEPGIWTGAGSIAFSQQWQRCDEAGAGCEDVTGATHATYTLGSSDWEHTIKVVIGAAAGAETATATSPASPIIGTEPTAPVSQSAPEAEGPATEGKTLTANPGTWLGSEPLTYAYQWQRCPAEAEAAEEEEEECEDIEGATASTYTLVEADVGSGVIVTVTASNAAGEAAASSEPSEVVNTPGPPSNTSAPTIDGTAEEGEQLAAAPGTWSGSRPFTYSYQWERCATEGSECSTIPGATKGTYSPEGEDVGHALRVDVTAANELGNAATVSASTAAVVAATGASAAESIEAIESADPSLLAPAEPATVEEQEVKPASNDADEALSSASTLTTSSIAKETPGEFAIETPAGMVTLEPTEVSSTAGRVPTIVNETAAIFAGTRTATDTIVRPDPLGATAIYQLQSAQAPTSFSWEVALGENQELRQLPDGSVAVVELPSESVFEPSLGEALEEPEVPGETGEEAEGGEEGGAGEESEESSLIEPLPAAPHASTPSFEPRSTELHPQDTAAAYAAADSALDVAEEEEGEDTTLMVIEPPHAIDAAGHAVPAALSSDEDTVTLTLSTEAETSYPVTAAASAASRGLKHPAVGPSFRYGLDAQHDFELDTSEEHRKPVNHLDTRLKTGPLNIGIARLVMFWRTLPTNPQLVKWLKAAGKAHLKPVIALSSCRQGRLTECVDTHEPRPGDVAGSVDRYRTALHKLFVGLRKLHQEKPLTIPPVTTWGAWNEPDWRLGPLREARAAPLAAYLWQAARDTLTKAGCKRCRVIAGEFADYEKSKPYARIYVNTILNKHVYWHGAKPGLWGMHDYADVVRSFERRGNPNAHKFLTELPWTRLGRPYEWMTEGGVQLTKGASVTEATGCWAKFQALHKGLSGACQHQRYDAKDFLQLRNVGTGRGARPFERVIYYLYRGAPAGQFDSALLEQAGSEPEDWRPAYCVLAFKGEKCPATATTASSVPGTLTSRANAVQLVVDPHESLANYWVEYGTTTEYGSSTAPQPVANEEGEQSEAVELSGLDPCTTYHYQAEAENEANEGEPSEGGDQTFTTPCGIIERYAGIGGICCGTGNGGPALSARIAGIVGLTAGADGSIYIGEGDYSVRRVDPSGTIWAYAGKPESNPGFKNGEASAARFGGVEGLALDAEGDLLFGDWRNQMVREVAPEGGTVSTFAGATAEQNYLTPPCYAHQDRYSGDGGSASAAGFGAPTAIAVGSDGSVYVGDEREQAVRRIGPEGTVETVAGYYDSGYNKTREFFYPTPPHELACSYETYEPPFAYSGDGEAATSAQLAAVTSIALGPEDTLYIAEGTHNTVRKVDLTTGVITRFAGTGEAGYSGDGGAATEAELNDANSVAIGPEGDVFIADECNSVVRRVDSSGVITTVAGNGYDKRNGDGGPATEAEIGLPGEITLDSSGNLFLSDRNGEVLRVEAPLGPGSTTDSGGETCGGGGAS